MRRSAPLLRVLAARVTRAHGELQQAEEDWQRSWAQATDLASRQRALDERIEHAIGRRDQAVREERDGLLHTLQGHRDAMHSGVIRVVRDAVDRAAVAPYLGRSPQAVRDARDAAIRGLVSQWRGLVQADVERTTARLRELAERDGWTRPNTLSQRLHALEGGEGLSLPPITPVAPVSVSVQAVLCGHAAIRLDDMPALPDAAAIDRLTAWAEDIAARTPPEPHAIGYSHIRDTWGRL